MNYGMYVTAASMMTNLYKLDVIGNNMANMSTAGFKPDVVTFRWRYPERTEAHRTDVNPRPVLEGMGGGVNLMPNHVDFHQGPMRETGNPLDLAIQGPGFFTLASGRGSGAQVFRYSRDGRLSLSGDGFLVQAATGMRILDEKNQPIYLGAGNGESVTIDPSGAVRQGGETVARIRPVAPPDLTILAKAGENAFKAPNQGSANMRPTDSSLRQNAIEESGVDSMQMLLELTNTQRAIEMATKMIQMSDQMTGSAVNSLGRVS